MEQGSAWNEIWDAILKEEKLTNTVKDLNEADGKNFTEEICRNIYGKYPKMSERLDKVKKTVESELEEIKGIHFSCGRIKTCKSLLAKVIKKRYEHINDRESKYTNINEDNFEEIITDLIGLKFIINYRGRWTDLHEDLLKRFPMLEESAYEENRPVPHQDGKKFMAEIPVAYYARNDNIDIYKNYKIKTKPHNAGYRSVHYIISCENTYIELQVRTIYDEAWSDCDHSYVYKKGSNANNKALKALSLILCRITNSASDISDSMHDIYYEKAFHSDNKGSWSVSEEYKEMFSKITDDLKLAVNELENFRDKLHADEEGE